MTAPATATQPPWRVRWAVYALTLLAILAFPGQVKALGITLIRNVAEITGFDDEAPTISPTDPPVVNP